MSNLSITDIVRVSAQIAPRGALRREFGISLFLTTDTTLDTGAARVEVFNDFRAIASRFDETTEPYKAGVKYFAQEPFPKNLVVGRWFETAASGRVYGGRVAALSVLQAITAGSITINGENISALDFSADLSYAAVAATLQTALQAGTDAGITDATVTYDPINRRFVIDSVTAGAAIEMTVATGVSADALGLSAAAGASAFNGADAESITDALQAIFALNNSFYHIILDATITDAEDIQEVIDWILPQVFMLSLGSTEAQTIVTGDTTSLFAGIAALEPSRVFGTYSATSDYKAASAAARLSSWNPAARNSVFTMKFKQLIGTLADDITATVKFELDRKRVNYYAPFSDLNMFAEGVTFDPDVFIDVRLWVDWFVNALQVDVFNLLYASNRVPQTDVGGAIIYDVIERVCQEGIRNGGIAPGRLSEALKLDVIQSTGNTDFDGNLPKGYLIFVPPYAEQAQADRNARKGTPPKIWVKGAGAIHSIELGLTFEN